MADDEEDTPANKKAPPPSAPYATATGAAYVTAATFATSTRRASNEGESTMEQSSHSISQSERSAIPKGSSRRSNVSAVRQPRRQGSSDRVTGQARTSAALREKQHARRAGSAGENKAILSHSQRGHDAMGGGSARNSPTRTSTSIAPGLKRSSTVPYNRPSTITKTMVDTVGMMDLGLDSGHEPRAPPATSASAAPSSPTRPPGLGRSSTTVPGMRTAASLGFATSTTSAPRTRLGGHFDADDDEPAVPLPLGTYSKRDPSLTLGQIRRPPPLSFFRRKTSDSSYSDSESSFRKLTNWLSRSGRSLGLGSTHDATTTTSRDSNTSLGSTILAERNQRFRQGVDQSVNLMDSEAADYGHADEPDGVPGRRSKSPAPNGRIRRPTKSNKRGSVMDIMFGGSHRTQIRKKSMVDISLHDPSKNAQLNRGMSTHQEEDEDTWWDAFKKYVVPFFLLMFLGLAALLMTFAVLNWIDANHETNNNNSPTTAPAPVVAVSPAPTPQVIATKVPALPPSSHKPTKPVETFSMSATGTTKLNDNTNEPPNAQVAEAKLEEPAAVAAEEARNATTTTATSAAAAAKTAARPYVNAGVSSLATKSAAQTTTKKKILEPPKVFGLTQKGVVVEEEEEEVIATDNNEPLTPLEELIVQSDLTSLEDLQQEQTSAYRALAWMQDTMPELAIASDAELLQMYCVAVFYYATHPLRGSSSSSNHTAEKRDASLLRGRSLLASGSRWLSETEVLEGTEWMQDTDLCNWKGIQCNEDQHVTHIKLPRGKLHGTLPSELRGFKDLLELDVSHNHIHGTIPPAVGELTLLTYIDVKRNNLTGDLPESLGNLTNLHEINVEYNRLKGPIPSSLNGMTNVLNLILSNNRLEGRIPPFANCTKLKLLSLDNNRLTGMVPFDSLSLLEDLEEFGAENNLLTGSIAPSIADFPNIQTLSLKMNRIGGSLPDEFTSHETLVELDLSMNSIHGPLPPSMGVLTQLKHLKLHNNDITGPIPATWFGMKGLESLIMDHNKLEGEIPAVLGDMLALRDLRLNHNKLTGPIPVELEALDNMQHLHLESNSLSGEIPDLGALVDSLETLVLFHNNITGNASFICSQDVSNLQEFVTDCISEVSCECCTACH